MSASNVISEVHYLLKLLRGEREYCLELLGSTEDSNNRLVGNNNEKDISPKIEDLYGIRSLEYLKQISKSDGSKVWDFVGENGRSICVASKIHDDRLIFSVYPESFLNRMSSNETANKINDKTKKRLKDKADEHARKFNSAEQELNDFTYSVSHDLRAPLRRLDGFSEALLSEEYISKLDEKGVHYLKRIRKAANDMGSLIDDLLKLSRISRKEIEVEEIDISAMLRESINELYDNDTLSKITFSIGDEITAYGDRGLVKVMLQNLLENAVKYSSKEKNPEIRVCVSRKEGKNIISVQDNGVGFDSKHSEKLFRAFQRLHSDFEFEGNGIGLATVKRIVSLHGGEIWAEGEEGEGAVFSFYL